MPALMMHPDFRTFRAHATPCCLQFNLFKDWEQAKKQASQVLGVAQAKAYETVEEVSTSTGAAGMSTRRSCSSDQEGQAYRSTRNGEAYVVVAGKQCLQAGHRGC